MSFKMERMEEQQAGRPHLLDYSAEWWNIVWRFEKILLKNSIQYVQNLTVQMMDDICHKVLDSIAPTNGEEAATLNGR